MDIMGRMALCVGMDLVTFAAVALLGAWFFGRRFGLDSRQRREIAIGFALVGTLVHFAILGLVYVPILLLTAD